MRVKMMVAAVAAVLLFPAVAAAGWAPVGPCQAGAFTPVYLGGHQFLAHTGLACSANQSTVNEETCAQVRGANGSWYTKPGCTVLGFRHNEAKINAYSWPIYGRSGGVYRSWGWYYVNGATRVVVSGAWRNP